MASDDDNDSFETSSCTSTSSSTDNSIESISSSGIDPVRDHAKAGNCRADALLDRSSSSSSDADADDAAKGDKLAVARKKAARARRVLNSAVYKKGSRASSLGQFRFCDDKTLLTIARFLNPRDLVQLGYVSWMFLMVAHDEPTWRRLTLIYHIDAKKRAATFCYHGSWRRTCLHPKRFPGRAWNEQDVPPPWRIALAPSRADAAASSSSLLSAAAVASTSSPVADAGGGNQQQQQAPLRRNNRSDDAGGAGAEQQDEKRLKLVDDDDQQQQQHEQRLQHETERRYWMVDSPTKPRYATIRRTRHQRWYDNVAHPPEQQTMFLGGVDRRSNLTYVDFVEQYEKPNRPVILTDAARDWKARATWNPDTMVQRFGKTLFNVNVKSAAGKKFRMRGFDYFAYCHTCANEKFLYVFDKKILAGDALRQDYDVPIYFSQDLFNLMTEDDRPDYRWLLLGPNGSGSPLHTDPHGTSAWNCVTYGAKRPLRPARLREAPLQIVSRAKEEDQVRMRRNPPSQQRAAAQQRSVMPDRWPGRSPQMMQKKRFRNIARR